MPWIPFSLLGFVIFVLAWLAITWSIARKFLSGPNLSQFDDPAISQVFEQHPDDAAANQRLTQTLRAFRHDLRKTRSLRKGLARAREFADNISADLVTDSTFEQIEVNGVKCEWTIAAGADPKRRILFMHGGAFFIGSPRGHRRMADQLAKAANAAVLSVDYRMLPEHSRKKGVQDCQTAYRWILENGPDGPSKPDLMLVSGDSAGGNLALMLSSWSKLANLPRPDGVIAFSPSTDVTMESPSLLSNRATDPILGQGIGALLWLPRSMRAWMGLFISRANPASPLMSPLFFDLTDLPKTLIHASSSEMLLGESIRYANKARAAGSDVTLQVWENQVHDWHIFNTGQGSANTAWQEVKKFIQSLDPAD